MSPIPSPPQVRHRRRGSPQPETPGVPLMAATASWEVLDRIGFNCRAVDTGALFTDALTKLPGVYHVRLGRVSMGANAPDNRDITAIIAAKGGTCIGIPDGYGAYTARQRIVEMRDNWNDTALFVEPDNEDNVGSNPDAWTTAQKDSTLNKWLAVKDARDWAYGPTGIPLMSLSWAQLGGVGWTTAIQTRAKSTASPMHGVAMRPDVINFHQYPGGQDYRKVQVSTSNPSSTAEVIAENTDQYELSGPVYWTEGGFHDKMTSTGGHKGTPDPVQAIYDPRAYIQLPLIGVDRLYRFEMADYLAGVNGADTHEAGFGLMGSLGSASAITGFSDKAQTIAMRNMQNILLDHAGRGVGFQPSSFKVQVLPTVAGGGALPNTIKYELIGRSDGWHYLMIYNEVHIYTPTTGSEGATNIPADVNVLVEAETTRTITYRRPSGSNAVVTPGAPSGPYNRIYSIPVGPDVTVVRWAPA